MKSEWRSVHKAAQVVYGVISSNAFLGKLHCVRFIYKVHEISGSFEDVISFYLRRQIHLTSYHNQFNSLFVFFLLTGPEASGRQVSS